MQSIIAASVVDFPDPVDPVTRMSPAPLFGDLFDDWWQAKLCSRLCLVGNDAKHNADGTSLLKDVRTKTSQARDTVANIDL
jgi:hypothetical protein